MIRKSPLFIAAACFAAVPAFAQMATPEPAPATEVPANPGWTRGSGHSACFTRDANAANGVAADS